ncbi:MAG: hypothetical protein HY579_01650 [Nitrospinae bacterium]|nr:hypothetical protein [Nitrospinota bacterium]
MFQTMNLKRGFAASWTAVCLLALLFPSTAMPASAWSVRCEIDKSVERKVCRATAVSDMGRRSSPLEWALWENGSVTLTIGLGKKESLIQVDRNKPVLSKSGIADGDTALVLLEQMVNGTRVLVRFIGFKGWEYPFSLEGFKETYREMVHEIKTDPLLKEEEKTGPENKGREFTL